jgi:hypothetical protein
MSEFTVNDRRLFTKEGDLAESTEEASAEAAVETAADGARTPETPETSEEEAKKVSDPGTAGAERDPRTSSLPATFSTLIVGLATTAMMHLGESLPDLPGPPPPTDLPAAKQTIDIIGVLEKKTKGNLDQGEEALLTALLYDLRIKYVSKSSGTK